MNQLNNRLTLYGALSKQLALMNDADLSAIIDNAGGTDSSIGGTTTTIKINGTNVFVKKIPLTDLERLPSNTMSTANIFDLPVYYHYGIGSAGFGAWRELAIHTMSTEWILTGECPYFPLTYHWRIMPASKLEPMNAEQLKELDERVEYWNGSSAIRRRLEAIHDASAHIVIFSEHIPQTLNSWLSTQLSQDTNTATLSIHLVEKNLHTITNFMNTHGLIHCDAHFDNILTDGHNLYFADFGLALSTQFKLSHAEYTFFNDHYQYDICYTLTHLLYCMITNLFGKDAWEATLQKYVPSEESVVTEPIALIIKRYAPLAFAMNEFNQKLQKESKTTPYPGNVLAQLYAKISDVS